MSPRVRGWLFAGEIGDPLELVDRRAGEAPCGEQRGEVPRDLRVEVAVAGTEDHLDGLGEAVLGPDSEKKYVAPNSRTG